jgi:hypothetical protein
MLNILDPPKDLTKLFKERRIISAQKFITEIAVRYHFVLINEAHYSSQNRAFTKSLLKPLWDRGYRYLALETLSDYDSLLLQRGYPINNTGYYTKESAFGNLVREAIQIGYRLIPYEFGSDNGNLRDSIQALNIVTRTIQKDSIGKVLVHAGYGHIFESGDRLTKPMGFQLKRLVKSEILTIDQETMTELNDEQKVHPYYKYVINNYKPDFPVVAVDQNNYPLVDPINSFGIDIQVYHPQTVYINERPKWLIDNHSKLYDLPKHIKKYSGYLIQVIRKGEAVDSTPVDQFVIGKNRSLVLPPGEYLFRLIDRTGSLEGKGTLSIK